MVLQCNVMPVLGVCKKNYSVLYVKDLPAVCLYTLTVNAWCVRVRVFVRVYLL